jgi:hypothetical protein
VGAYVFMSISHNDGKAIKLNVFEDDHRTLLIKLTADKYFTLRLFTYSKRYNETVVTKGKPSERYQLTKLILLRNQ